MLPIGVVARQTGIQIATLRKWESRYGFPLPQRGKAGQRCYRSADVEKLLSIVRRTAAGERVSKVIREYHSKSLSDDLASKAEPSSLAYTETVQPALKSLCAGDLACFKSVLNRAFSAYSKLVFVEQVAAPLGYLVGECWANGQLPIHGEHLFSFFLENLLLHETNLRKTVQDRPRILLTTPSGEKHTLGLAMVAAILGDIGFPYLMLPGDLPLPEIVAAAKTYNVRAVGLSASLHYPPRTLRSTIKSLRAALPDEVALWLGGSGMNSIRQLPKGSMTISSMQQLLHACEEIACFDAATPNQNTSGRS